MWICADELGHIQAVGTDAAGRRQYLYHEAWRERRDREKFKRLPEFAEALIPARKALEADLELKGLVRERVMACAIRLLDIGTFRVGGEDYAEENESYGLATLEKRHVTVSAGGIDFEFVAKGGIEQSQRDRGPARRSHGSGAEAPPRPTRPTRCLPIGWARGSGTTCPRPRSTSGSRTSSAPTTRPRTSAPGTAPCWPR